MGWSCNQKQCCCKYPHDANNMKYYCEDICNDKLIESKNNCCCNNRRDFNNKLYPNDNNKKIAFQIQSTTNQDILILDNENIPFDRIVYENDKNIKYNARNKSIAISKMGTYSVSWIITIAGIDVNDSVTFAIETTSGKSILSSSPIITQQLVGQAIIEVKRYGTSISLVNKSNALVQLANLPVQVNLSIIEV